MLIFLLADNLIDKYGKGSTQIHKCQIREYEENICSEDTYITEGGSLKVYAEGGKFVCPNCGPTTVDVNHDVNCKNVNVTLLLSNNLIARQPYGFYNTTHI